MYVPSLFPLGVDQREDENDLDDRRNEDADSLLRSKAGTSQVGH